MKRGHGPEPERRRTIAGASGAARRVSATGPGRRNRVTSASGRLLVGQALRRKRRDHHVGPRAAPARGDSRDRAAHRRRATHRTQAVDGRSPTAETTHSDEDEGPCARYVLEQQMDEMTTVETTVEGDAKLDAQETARPLALMSDSWSSIQSPGSRAVTIEISPSWRRWRSS
jgi:hypothetical protein